MEPAPAWTVVGIVANTLADGELLARQLHSTSPWSYGSGLVEATEAGGAEEVGGASKPKPECLSA